MQQIKSKNDNIGQTRTKLRKKANVIHKYNFQENKKEEKHITDTIEVKSTSQGKIHNTEKYGREGKREREGSMMEWDLERVCFIGFWEGKCGTNMGSTGGRKIRYKEIQ